MVCATFLLALTVAQAPPSDPVIDRAMVERLFAEVVPWVEEETGARLAGRVTVDLASTQELGDEVSALPIASARLVGGERQVELARMQFARLTSFLGTGYSPARRAVLIAPEGIRALHAAHPSLKPGSEASLRSMLVEGLARARLDLEHSLLRRATEIRTVEEGLVLAALVKWHVRRVVARLAASHPGQVAPSIEAAIEASDAPLEPTLAPPAPDLLGSEPSRVFFDELERLGGRAAIEQVLARPPATLDVLRHPQWIVEPELRPRRSCDLIRVAERLLDVFPRDRSTRMHISLYGDEPTAQSLVAGHGGDVRAQLLASVRDVRSVFAGSFDGDESVGMMCSIYELARPEDARLVVGRRTSAAAEDRAALATGDGRQTTFLDSTGMSGYLQLLVAGGRPQACLGDVSIGPLVIDWRSAADATIVARVQAAFDDVARIVAEGVPAEPKSPDGG